MQDPKVEPGDEHAADDTQVSEVQVELPDPRRSAGGSNLGTWTVVVGDPLSDGDVRLVRPDDARDDGDEVVYWCMGTKDEDIGILSREEYEKDL